MLSHPPENPTINQKARIKLHDIIKSHGLDINKCNVVVETLLALIGIQYLPKGSWYNFYKEEYCVFSFTISEEIAKEWVGFFNDVSHALKAKDITEEIRRFQLSWSEFLNDSSNKIKAADILKYCAPLAIGSQPARIIRMESNALEQKIMPKIDEYLKNHPEYVLKHKRISTSRMEYRYSEWVKKTREQFLQYGMDISKCNCYEFIVTCMTQNAIKNMTRIDVVSRCFFSIFPEFVRQHIFDYMKDYSYEANLSDVAAAFEQKRGDPHALTFTFPLGENHGDVMLEYFNKINLGSAEVDDVKYESFMDENKQIVKPNIKINVDIESLSHPRVLSEIKDAFEHLPQSMRDHFRKQSGKIVCTTAEYLQQLRRVNKDINKYKLNPGFDEIIDYKLDHPELKKIWVEEGLTLKEAKKQVKKQLSLTKREEWLKQNSLTNKIYELIQHIDEHGLDQEEHKPKLESLISEIQSLSIYLKMKTDVEESKIDKVFDFFKKAKNDEERKNEKEEIQKLPEIIFNMKFDLLEGLHGIKVNANKKFELNLSDIRDNDVSLLSPRR